MATRIGVAQRFWPRVDFSGGWNSCWPYTGCIGSAGYGELHNDGKTVRAHRLAYQLTKGSIPAGLDVRHACHNRACCNPEHLSVGTRADNVLDTCVAGRHQNAKLTRDDVRWLRWARDYAGSSFAQMARTYGLDISTVHAAVRGKTWKHV